MKQQRLLRAVRLHGYCTRYLSLIFLDYFRKKTFLDYFRKNKTGYLRIT